MKNLIVSALCLFLCVSAYGQKLGALVSTNLAQSIDTLPITTDAGANTFKISLTNLLGPFWTLILSTGSGNMTNTGAATVGMVPVATDTTGTQWSPSDTIPTLNVTTLHVGALAVPSLDVTNSIHAQNITASRAVVTDALNNLTNSVTTAAEIAFVSGGTSSFQTQINGKQASDNDLLRLANITSASGDLFYRDATGWTNLAKGSDGKFLTLASGLPSWVTVAFTDLSGSVAAAQMPALTGAVVTSAGAVATTPGKTDVLQASEFAADAGANDTYVATLSPAISAYVTGARYRFKANTANTGAATLNLNGLGAKTIKKPVGGVTTDLADNDIRAGQWVEVAYDGTNLQMLSQLGNAGSGTGDALVANPLSQFAATTSAQLYGVISDETGIGKAVFADGPTLGSATVTSNLTVGSISAIGSGTNTMSDLNVTNSVNVGGLTVVSNIVVGGTVTAASFPSPSLTGNPTAANQALSDSDTSIANTAFVSSNITVAVTYARVTNALSLTGSTSTFVRSDGTQATPAGSGTVTATGGSLTANAVVLGAGGTDTKVSSSITTDGSAKVTLGTLDLGNTTDTTLARSGAGDVTIEGNAIYRAGGTDVAVADGGTGLSSGTSGGILGYTASGTLASSGALTAGGIVVGGGAGATPTVVTAGATTDILVGGGALTAPVWTTATGTGAPVRATTPHLTTPDIGAATAATVVVTNAVTAGSGNVTGSFTNGALTASQAVVTAADKSLASVAYTGSGNVMRTRTGVWRSIPVTAGSLMPGKVSAPYAAATATTNTPTSAYPHDAWTFSPTATNTISLTLPMPLSWDAGTVKIGTLWSCTSTNSAAKTNFVVGYSGVGAALGSVRGALGTEVFTTNQVSSGSTTPGADYELRSPAITPAGSPVAGSVVQFAINGYGGNASTTITNTGLTLVGAILYYNESATEPSAP